jgi:hypothetical protein
VRWHIHFDRPVNPGINNLINEVFVRHPDCDPFFLVKTIQVLLIDHYKIRATFTMSPEFQREGIQYDMQGLWGRN